MFRKKLLAAMAAAVLGMTLFGEIDNAIAHEGQEHDGAKDQAGRVETAKNGKICLVSGEGIAKDAQIEYKYEGKVYDLCCSDCLEKFQKDPERYIGKLNGGVAEATTEPKHHDDHDHDHD